MEILKDNKVFPDTKQQWIVSFVSMAIFAILAIVITLSLIIHTDNRVLGTADVRRATQDLASYAGGAAYVSDRAANKATTSKYTKTFAKSTTDQVNTVKSFLSDQERRMDVEETADFLITKANKLLDLIDVMTHEPSRSTYYQLSQQQQGEPMELNKALHPSIWTKNFADQGFPELNSDLVTQVLVIGAGITGVMTADMLAKSGVDVTVIDAGDVAGATTGFSTAKVTALHGLKYSQLETDFDQLTARNYASANKNAIDIIANTIEEYSIECDFTKTSACTFTQDPNLVSKIEEETEAAKRAGLPAELITTSDLPFPIEAGVSLSHQAYFDPYQYCLGVAREIVKAGAKVFIRTRAQNMEHINGGVEITTDDVTIKAQRVVFASHIPFVNDGQYYMKMAPNRSYAIAVSLNRDDDYILGTMNINIENEMHSLRPGPSGSMIVGGGGHRVGQMPDGNPYVKIQDWVNTNFGAHEVLAKWSTQDYISGDGIPYIGHLDDNHDNVFLATGFSKWGMTNGVVAAKIISDELLGAQNAEAQIFNSRRDDLKQSAKAILTGGLAVTKHLVGDKVATLIDAQETDPNELAVGQGKIITIAGKKVAAYKTDDGVIKAVSHKCTHMGCDVIFNDLEKSWDCPCHGSRFDVDGTVLDGPTCVDLKIV